MASRIGSDDDDMFSLAAVPCGRASSVAGHPIIMCRTCDKVVSPTDAVYNARTDQHHECGLAEKALQTALRATDRTEVKKKFDELPKDEQRDVMKLMVPGSAGNNRGAKRSSLIQKAITMIQEQYRQRELRSRRGWAQMDKLEFVAHWRFTKGRSKAEAKKEWKKAKVDPKAVTINGTRLVWVKLRREVYNDDVVGCSLRKTPQNLDVDQEAARSLMRGGLNSTAMAAEALDLPSALMLDSSGDEAPKPNSRAIEDDSSEAAEGDSDGESSDGGGSESARSEPEKVRSQARKPSTAISDKRCAELSPEVGDPKPARKKAKKSSEQAMASLQQLPMKATQPLELMEIKMAFRSAVAAKSIEFQEKGRQLDKVARMKASLAKFSDHKDIKCLDIETIAREATSAHDALSRFQNEIDDWTCPFDVVKHRNTFDMLCDTFKSKMDAVRGYQDMADCLATSEKDSIRDQKRKARNHIDTIAQNFGKIGMPKAVGRAMAIVLGQHTKASTESNPAPLMTSIVLSTSTSFELTAADQETSSPSIFDDPRGLSAESAEKTHWHSELSTFVTTHHETIGIKMDKSITRLEKANGTHCLFTVTPEQPFKWNPADATKTPFDVAAGVQTVGLLSKCGTFMFHRSANPFAGVGQFMTCVRGCVVALLVRHASVPQNVDLSEFLSSQAHDVLKREPACVLRRGDSLWVPFGCTAVLASIHSSMLEAKRGQASARDREQPQKEYGAVVCHLAFDERDADRGAGVCSTIAGELTKASSSIPASIASAPFFTRWKLGVEKAGASACALPAGSGAPAQEGDAVAPVAGGVAEAGNAS